MAESMIINGQPATITYDQDLGLFRGEFTELAGSADFYAESREALATEGRASLKVYLEVCQERGLSPSKPRPGTLDALLAREKPQIVEAARKTAGAMFEDIKEEEEIDAPPPTDALRKAFEGHRATVMGQHAAGSGKASSPLISEESYRAALKEVSAMFDLDPEPDPSSEKGRRLDALISLIEAYEILNFGIASPITTPMGEVVTLSEEVIAGMLPGELLHTPRDSDHWQQWRDAAVENLPYATRVLSAAARQRLHASRPEVWQDVLSICHEALRISDASKDARGSDALASLLETMRSLREVGAIQREDLESFESTIGIPVETRSLEGDTHTAEIAFKALSKEDLDALATHTSPAWVRVSRQRLVVGLADGRWVSCPLEWFPACIAPAKVNSITWSSPRLGFTGPTWTKISAPPAS